MVFNKRVSIFTHKYLLLIKAQKKERKKGPELGILTGAAQSRGERLTNCAFLSLASGILGYPFNAGR